MTRCSVLMYHGLYANEREYQAIDAADRPYAVSTQRFTEQLQAMQRSRLNIIDPGQLGSPAMSAGGVVLTFDDGHASNHRHALPILQQLGLKAVFFVTSDFMERRPGFCSWAQLREMADRAELRALQSKINPHFLFNALNAISTSIRLNPDTARQLIINLSRYLRYNLERNDEELIDIKSELYQVKDYIAIEQARFGDKLTVIYDIDEEVSCHIPSLLIQPLIENAIVHGIRPCKGKGVVTLSIQEQGERIRVAVRDTGSGISDEVIARVERNELPGNKIGLLNVHHRIKLLYGEGLRIRRLNPGTEIEFFITRDNVNRSDSMVAFPS